MKQGSSYPQRGGPVMDANVAGYLDVFGWVDAIARPAIVVLVLLGLWRALGRASLDRRSTIAVWLAVAIPLVLWLGVAWSAALSGVFRLRLGPIPLLPIAV